MPIWIFRIATLVAFPFLTYTFIKQDWMTILSGLLCGAIVIAGEVLFKRLRLIKIMIACTGLLMGYMLFVLIGNVVGLVEHQDALNWWNNYAFKAEIVLLAFGVLASIWKSRDLEGLSYKGHHLKIADITALIDGRIIDLCEINFLSGIIVLPVFVLEELNKMAASNDPLERARGRRGLDVATRLQELKEITTRITNKNVKAPTMEEKIVKLAKSLDAEVVTLDFNVNKAAVLQNVIALNIADLATALKPVVLPGEDMSLFVMKEGKEKEQGIGYLDDGTMVVVEDGRRAIGKRVEVAVYSILQTSSGRMIFAKVK
ncbi:PIN/TRAM domain-containing protein [Candidatus Avelusimicrobium caledoniensis]|uniref:PIN/TRAM domain-containing protein n=1 Tax=Candidatus Avelusimicrobium caledoniensis TaxID=3416220 RepID=UPI003D13C04F